MLLLSETKMENKDVELEFMEINGENEFKKWIKTRDGCLLDSKIPVVIRNYGNKKWKIFEWNLDNITQYIGDENVKIRYWKQGKLW